MLQGFQSLTVSTPLNYRIEELRAALRKKSEPITGQQKFPLKTTERATPNLKATINQCTVIWFF